MGIHWFNILAEKEKIPLFVATTCMVMQTPSIEQNTNSDTKYIENIIDSMLKKRVDPLVKKCDQSVTKTEQGNKKIEEILKRLKSFEHNETKTARFPQRPEGMAQNANNVHLSSNTPLTENGVQHGNLANSNAFTQPWTPNPSTFIASVPHPQAWSSVVKNTNTAAVNQPWSATPNPIVSKPPTQPTTTDQPWTMVSKKSNQRQKQKSSWKQNLHFLQGTGGTTKPSENSSENDGINIVAYKVKKNVTETDMSNWLLQKGLHIKNCKLMTKSSEAPFLSYKITIDKNDFERATQDANLWPYGVGVRLFVDFNKDFSDSTQFRYGESKQRN